MPFVSTAQKGWMYANHPEMAAKWQKHTPKGKKLPEHVEKKAAALRAILKTSVIAGPGPSVVPGIPGPMKVQPGAQPAQGPAVAPSQAAQAIPQLPGANDHPSAQMPPAGPPGAPAGQPGAPAGQPAAPPGPPQPQPLNQADATTIARTAQMNPKAGNPVPPANLAAISKTAALYCGLRQIALRSVL